MHFSTTKTTDSSSISTMRQTLTAVQNFWTVDSINSSRRVDGICGSGQNGTVKNWGVENAGVDVSARYGKGGQCGRNNTVTKAAYKIRSLEVENDSL